MRNIHTNIIEIFIVSGLISDLEILGNGLYCFYMGSRNLCQLIFDSGNFRTLLLFDVFART